MLLLIMRVNGVFWAFPMPCTSKDDPHNVKVTALISGGMRTPFLLERFPDLDLSTLQDPRNVAKTVLYLFMQPEETVISEMMVLPMKETSWP